jgi:hypothetical protein
MLLHRNQVGIGIAQWQSAGLRGGWSRVRVPVRPRNYSSHHCVRTGSGAHPVYCSVVPWALSLGINCPGREADHSPPSISEVNAWSYISTLPIRLHGVVLSYEKAQEQLYLYLYITAMKYEVLGDTCSSHKYKAGLVTQQKVLAMDWNLQSGYWTPQEFKWCVS